MILPLRIIIEFPAGSFEGSVALLSLRPFIAVLPDARGCSRMLADARGCSEVISDGQLTSASVN